jgi:hypothetical protein
MLVLFDHGVPAPLVPYLIDHTVVKARDRGWDRLSNGDLLAEAERAGFEGFSYRGQEHPIPAKSCWPQNSDCGAEHSAMAASSIARRENCGGDKCG